jgi:hypothetical protein
MLDGSNIPHVERANPEEFIHLFLNNSERLVEFLEHLVKVLDFCSSLSRGKCRTHKMQKEFSCQRLIDTITAALRLEDYNNSRGLLYPLSAILKNSA